MPVKRRAPRRLDVPAPDFLEEAELLSDPETALDPEKWERWIVLRGAPRPWSYRDGALKSLERGLACSALGLDPDLDVSGRAAALLAEKADKTADWYLHGGVGSGTGRPTEPAELEAWRAQKAAPWRYWAEFWRARLEEVQTELARLGEVTEREI